MMLMTAAQLTNALTGITNEQDLHYIQATFGITVAQAKTMLASMQKAEHTTKQAKRPGAGSTGDQPSKRPRGRRRRNVCYQCGAGGSRYHVYTTCPKWLRGDKPSKGSKFAEDLKRGKSIPTPPAKE